MSEQLTKIERFQEKNWDYLKTGTSKDDMIVTMPTSDEGLLKMQTMQQTYRILSQTCNKIKQPTK